MNEEDIELRELTMAELLARIPLGSVRNRNGWFVTNMRRKLKFHLGHFEPTENQRKLLEYLVLSLLDSESLDSESDPQLH